MESGLFILDAIVIVVAVIMSLRDDRAGPDRPSTSYFRYADVAAVAEPSRPGRNRPRSRREPRASMAADPGPVTRRDARNGRTGSRPTRSAPLA